MDLSPSNIILPEIIIYKIPDNLTDFTAKFEALERKRVTNYIVWRMSAKSYHTTEMKNLLQKKLVSTDIIADILPQLAEKGYFNDDDWIERFVKQHQKKIGLKSALQKLYLLNFTSEDLVKVEHIWLESYDEKTKVQEIINSKFQYKNLSDPKVKQKVVAGLMRKGFSYESIKCAVDLFLEN